MAVSTLLVLVVFTIIEIAVVLVVAGSVFVVSRRKLKFGENAVCVGSLLFRKEFPYHALDLKRATAIDTRDDDYRRVIRLAGGVSALGIDVGWFRLENGSDAYVHLWKQVGAVYIPMENHKALVLGVADPTEALARLPGKQV